MLPDPRHCRARANATILSHPPGTATVLSMHGGLTGIGPRCCEHWRGAECRSLSPAKDLLLACWRNLAASSAGLLPPRGQVRAAGLFLAAPGYWLQTLSERSLQSGSAPLRQPVTHIGASPAFLRCLGRHGGPLCRCRKGRGVSNTGRRADPGCTPPHAMATASATRGSKEAKAGIWPLRGL